MACGSMGEQRGTCPGWSSLFEGLYLCLKQAVTRHPLCASHCPRPCTCMGGQHSGKLAPREDLLFYHLPVFAAPNSASALQSSNCAHQFEDMTVSCLIAASIRILTVCILLNIMSAREAEENVAQVASCKPWKTVLVDVKCKLWVVGLSVLPKYFSSHSASDGSITVLLHGDGHMELFSPGTYSGAQSGANWGISYIKNRTSLRCRRTSSDVNGRLGTKG